MRKNEIAFMALGGGQSVGASCYFLRLGNSALLLDCGIGIGGGRKFTPRTDLPVEAGLIGNMNDIDQVYISHAHLDHAGFWRNFAAKFNHPLFYMTNITLALSRSQSDTPIDDFYAERVRCVSYGQEISFDNYRVSFAEAGHIPGAMMVLLNFGRRNILYTGDYSLNPTLWTGGCRLPDATVDILIVCGLHARHPHTGQSTNTPQRLLAQIRDALHEQKSVYLSASQLSKGLEFIRLLGSSDLSEYPIFLEPSMYKIINPMESLGIPILTENIAPFEHLRSHAPHIVFGKDKYAPDYGYTVLKVDFTLHDNFAATVDFVKRINPRLAIFVHSPPAPLDDYTVEQVLLRDGDCRTQCIFAHTGEVYIL